MSGDGNNRIRIFSYLPNPRVFKATIAARFFGGAVKVDVRGAPPTELVNWLWDFDAQPTKDVDPSTLKLAERVGRVGFKGNLYKTDAFLVAHPFGTVPAAFSADGSTGVFESNSIMRAVARLGASILGASAAPIYGANPFAASRVDSFLDASLVFARDTQSLLLARGDGSLDKQTYTRAVEALATYLGGIENALKGNNGVAIVEDSITLADICFACEIALLHNEKLTAARNPKEGMKPVLDGAKERWPVAMEHFEKLVRHPCFVEDLGGYMEKFAKL
jgi:glutathione S-transferase